MSTQIESLELEIKSSSESASTGIDSLRTSLEKLRDATKGGLGLTSVAKGLESVKKATDEMGNITSKLSGLSRAVTELTKLGNIKVSASIGNQIKNINTALAGLNVGDGGNKIQELVTALKPLETLDKSSLGTTVNALNKLPEAMDKIDTRKLYSQVSSLTRIMKPLADEMQKIANGFNAFPSRIQKLIRENEKLTASNNKTTTSYINLWAKMRMAYNTIRTGARYISETIKESMDYTENVNLFNVAMGEYADEARTYAEQVGEIMGIDPGEWMRNQGVFMTLATGFGVVGERANKMSKNLTQLGYDISSLFNLPYEDAMLKLQSGLAGELEPLRRIGFDLSVARLQQEAYTLGINKKVSAMTQAEKAELRYHAIMTQVTTSHKDMARTLDAPANQMRVLRSQITQASRAIGNIFIPVLQVVLPYCIAFAKVIRLVADSIAKLVGFKDFTADLTGIDGLASGAEDYSDALGDAAKNAKKLKQYTMGFDELNIIDPNSGSDSSGSGSVGVGGSGFDFELPEYNFLGKESMEEVNRIVENIKNNLSTVLTIVTGIGAVIAGWAISKVVTLAIALREIAGLKFAALPALTGLTLFMQDLTKFKDYLDDFRDNGASFYNVSGMISTFAGMIGDALILLGNVKIGGALKVIEGIGQIIGAIDDMSKNGVNMDNALSAINGLSNIAIGIGVFTKNWALVGVGMVTQGLTTVIEELSANWEAIKKGDWSGVNKVALAIGAIEVIGGLVTALSIFKKTKKVADIGDAGKEIADVGNTVTGVDTSVSSLTPKLKTLATNLGLGTLIIAEVAVAAGLIVGSIWGIGLMLGQIAEAWKPVIENGAIVNTAIFNGTVLLVAIGIVTATLGTLGGAMCGQMAIGIAVLAEIGVATGLFLLEIWAIGKALEEIGKAWKPVLNDSKTVEKAIEKGTTLLVAIGVVTAALGVATVASAGALPIAIGLGTAILLELGVAFGLFCDNLVDVADKLSDDLYPALNDLNDILPDLNDDMGDFVDFMGEFAEKTVEYTKNSAISGLSGTVDSIIRFFTKDPIKSLADDVDKQYKQAVTLNQKLTLANPELSNANSGLKIYKERIDNLKTTIGTIDTSDMSATVFTDMVTMSEKLADFGKKMKSYYNQIKDIKTATMDKMVTCINDVIDFAVRIKNEVETKKIDEFTESIKKLTTAVKNLPTSKTLTISAIYNTSGKAPRQFASGGFPNEGELFVAREAGAEMVGSIGRKTAVANNEQIVSAVSAGVAKAVGSVMGTMQAATPNGGTFRIKGSDLIYVADKANKNKGTTISNNFKYGGR